MPHEDEHPLLSSGRSADGKCHPPYNQDYGSTKEEGFHLFSQSMCVPEPQPVTLTWEDVSVYVSHKTEKKTTTTTTAAKAPDAEQGQTATTNFGGGCDDDGGGGGLKRIIKDVSGVVQPGTLLAILGASGAGKSTLMNVLTNRNLKDYTVQGQVKVNGVAIGKGIRNISAYVQQDELFIGTLTVRETLIFRAMLRMDQSIKKKARLERVEEVIQEMGLMKCAETEIGQAGRKKGISGGESKRLSFACEMLTNPPVLFCDEPTSGLDTFMAQNIVQILQAMAGKKRTILCTIHQPSSEIFAMFDRVLLLSEGRVAYMGPSRQAMEFFRSMNYLCPNNFNPADFYVLTLAIVPGKETQCRHKVNAICDAFTKTQDAKELKQLISDNNAQTKGDSLIEEAFQNASRYKASWGQQFLTVLWRSWTCVYRDVVLFRVRILQAIVVAVMLGLIYLDLTLDQKGVMNINGAIFLLLTNATFSNVFAVINTFPHEMSIFLREYGSGLYRTDVYYIAKSLAEIPTFILQPFIIITIDYWMMGLYRDGIHYLIALAIFVLVSNVAASFGLFLSTMAGNVNIALAISPLFIIPVMMFGGFFLNQGSVPVYFVWLEHLSWFKYANEYLAVNQWQDVNFIACESNSSGVPCQYQNGEDVLRYLTFSADDNWLNLGLLLTLFGGFRLLSYVFLLIRARRSKS